MVGGAGRNHPLSREEILAGALAIIDADGLEALSMRRLARDLGVEAMTLYHHLENKEAILSGVSQLVIGGMRVPDPVPTDWKDLMEVLLVALREALAAHPNAMPLVVRYPAQGDEYEAYMKTPAQALAAAGFTPQQSGEIFQAIMSYTFGHALLGTLAGDTAGPLDESSFRKPLRFMLNGFETEAAPGGD